MDIENDVDVTDGKDVAARSEVARGRAPVVDDEVVMDDPGDGDVMRQREDAFDGGGYEWAGRVLEPYSSSRDSLFVRMRRMMGAPSMAEVFEDLGLFKGDAYLILFLCSLTGPELVARMRNMEGFVAESLAWADDNVGRGESAEAVGVALDVFNGSRANVAEALPDEDGLDTGAGVGK